jgi:hypothetical protein
MQIYSGNTSRGIFRSCMYKSCERGWALGTAAQCLASLSPADTHLLKDGIRLSFNLSDMPQGSFPSWTYFFPYYIPFTKPNHSTARQLRHVTIFVLGMSYLHRNKSCAPDASTRPRWRTWSHAVSRANQLPWLGSACSLSLDPDVGYPAKLIRSIKIKGRIVYLLYSYKLYLQR